MSIGKLLDDDLQTAIRVAKSLSNLEKISPGVIDQASVMAKYECRYDGILDLMFDIDHSDEQIARNFGLSKQTITRMRSKIGARKSMRDMDLDYALMVIESKPQREAMELLKIRDDVYIILKNKHMMGQDTDYNIGKLLKVGYTSVYFWRMRLGIAAKSKGWHNKERKKKNVIE